MVPCHLKPKFALRLACALEDVSLLQVAHDPMVPRSERIFSQRGHFHGKFCILTSLAIIWPDLWLTGWCWVRKECNTIFPAFQRGQKNQESVMLIFNVGGWLSNLLLFGMKVGESLFQSKHVSFWEPLAMTIDPFKVRSFRYVSAVRSKTLILCGHPLLRTGSYQQNVSTVNQPWILKMRPCNWFTIQNVVQVSYSFAWSIPR